MTSYKKFQALRRRHSLHYIYSCRLWRVRSPSKADMLCPCHVLQYNRLQTYCQATGKDWTVQNGGGQLLSPPNPTPLEERLSLTDKVLVYQDLTPVTTATTPVDVAVSTSPSSSQSLIAARKPSPGKLFQGERNAEGGFRPMIPRLN